MLSWEFLFSAIAHPLSFSECTTMCEWFDIAYWLVMAAATAAVSYSTYYLWFMPMNRVRSVLDRGYSHLGRDHSGERKKMWANRQRRAKKVGAVPPAFPNGWFVVVESRNVSSASSLETKAELRTSLSLASTHEN